MPTKHQQADDPSPHELPQIPDPAAAGSAAGGTTAGHGENEEQRHDDLVRTTARRSFDRNWWKYLQTYDVYIYIYTYIHIDIHIYI